MAEHTHHSISKLFIAQVIIPQVMFFLAYLYSMSTHHGNLHPQGWPILFCRPKQEPRVSHSQHRRNPERFWKKCRWMDQKGRNKQGRNPWHYVACMAIGWPTPDFKGRTFKLFVLTRWDFNSYIRSSPLRSNNKKAFSLKARQQL